MGDNQLWWSVALDGASTMSHVDFKKWQCPMSLSLIFHICHMSNLRKGYVPYVIIILAPVACHIALYHMSNLRNAHVALSNLGV